MGFVSDIADKIGNQFGFGGGANQFKSQAPVNSFQATPATLDQSNYGQTIQQAQQAALGGGGAGTAANQSALAQALMARMNGQGPSVAEQQLRQATDQNSQLAAGAIGSQRGINPGLAARMILQNQAAGNQNSAGQAATLRAQEQLSNSSLLAQALSAQRGQDISQQQANTSLMGTSGLLQQGQNALNLQNSLGTQQLNQATAAQNAGLNLGSQQINAGVASQNAGIQSQAIGGLMNGIGSALGNFNFTGGGSAGGGGFPIGGAGGLSESSPLGGATMFESGGPVPGKAPVAGDDGQNDTVPAMLSPGEIVLPRSVAQAPDAEQRAKEFVSAIKKHHESSAPKSGYGRVLAIHRELSDRLRRLEHLAYGGAV